MTDSDDATASDRRVIPQRDTSWAKATANALYRARIRPNHISVASAAIAVLGAALLISSATTWGAPRNILLIAAALTIPVRLLFNMLDGMLAVEKGLHSPTGDLYNEVPDRLADLVLLAAAGYATSGLWMPGGVDAGVLLGWIAASAAVGTAYVRTLGAAQGVGHFFTGPAAKPARMWILFLACLAAVFEPLAQRGLALTIALGLIAAGSLLTIVLRLRNITRALHARAALPPEDAR